MSQIMLRVFVFAVAFYSRTRGIFRRYELVRNQLARQLGC